MKTQIEMAQSMYDARAATYEDSWHPDYSKRFVDLVNLKPGDRVLDLCCGTGLEAFLAAASIGDKGEVIGVDITMNMLEQLALRQDREPDLGSRIKAFHHDVNDLASLPELVKSTFDWIMCSNAFVLLEEPAKVVRQWKEYLKPGGSMVVDITHEHNLRSGVIIERVAERLGETWPWNRSWIKSKDSFKDILEQEGLVVDKIEELTKTRGQKFTFYTLDEADAQFDYITQTALSEDSLPENFRERGRPVFKEEWAKDAVDGKVAVVDSLYVYIARRTE